MAPSNLTESQADKMDLILMKLDNLLHLHLHFITSVKSIWISHQLYKKFLEVNTMYSV